MQPCRMRLWFKILLCVLVITLLGGAGAVFTSGSLKDWYAGLEKPPGVPPNWLFGPVWTVLYAMMGISLARVWHFVPTGPAKTRALVRFAIQMILNLTWTPVFFGAHLLAPALAVIVFLWIMILLTIFAFKPLDRIAAMLLVPYLVWVSYATYLNAGYLALN